MSINKIIFAIVGAIILAAILFISFGVKKAENNTPKRAAPGDFTVWILDDNKDDFFLYLDGFKKANPTYASKNILVESFSNQEIYYNTLVSAVISGDAPDMYVMGNREISPLTNQALGINPELISPNDFRLRFQPVFSEDLIITDPNDETLEFLKGVPLGYETLGVYYSRKYFLRPSELSTWTDFAKEVRNIGEKQRQVIPIALGNSSVSHPGDIVSSLLVAEGDTSIYDTENTSVRSALSLYSSYGQRNGDNRYDTLTSSFAGKSDIEYFTEGDVAAMIGYPRDLIKIASIGYQKSFLFATPFPQFAGSEKKSAVKYNYFAVNKDSSQTDMGQAVLAYMSSPEGQQAYIDVFPYYLSPELALSSEMYEKKIIPEYNIVYKNFIDENSERVSYDMGSIEKFLNQTRVILDQNSNQETSFENMRDLIICGTTKHKTLLNLSSPCK